MKVLHCACICSYGGWACKTKARVYPDAPQEQWTASWGALVLAPCDHYMSFQGGSVF